MDNIRFYSEPHTYHLGNRELISVSHIIKKFHPKKDWNIIATKYAKKNGETSQYWLDKWADKAKKSTDIGTLYHEIREENLINTENPEFFGVKCKILSCSTLEGVKYSIPISNLPYNTVFPELIISDVEAGVCGQSDKVVTTDTHIHVLDYKTDKEIAFKGYSNQWKPSEKYLYPVSHLDVCNGNDYSLKMSMYMYMIWKQNKHLKPGKIILEHKILKRDDEGIPVLEDGLPVILEEREIELPYRKSEVMAIFALLKEEKQNQLPDGDR